MYEKKIVKRIEEETIKKENHIVCMMIFAFQCIYGQNPPVELEFNQSTLQAFYFFIVQNLIIYNFLVYNKRKSSKKIGAFSQRFN